MIRVGLHQASPGSGFSDKDESFYLSRNIDVLVLPEYFWVRNSDQSHSDALLHAQEDLSFLAELSRRRTWLIAGGTVVVPHDSGAWQNACPLFYDGRDLGRYYKQQLMPGEIKNGALPGTEFLVVEALGLNVAPMICADVLVPDAYSRLRLLNPDLILAPMASPYLEHDTLEDKQKRDQELFVRGAEITGACITKAAGVGTLFGRPLQGRCLAAGSQGVLFRTPFDEELKPHRWIVELEV